MSSSDFSEIGGLGCGTEWHGVAFGGKTIVGAEAPFVGATSMIVDCRVESLPFLAWQTRINLGLTCSPPSQHGLQDRESRPGELGMSKRGDLVNRGLGTCLWQCVRIFRFLEGIEATTSVRHWFCCASQVLERFGRCRDPTGNPATQFAWKAGLLKATVKATISSSSDIEKFSTLIPISRDHWKGRDL